MPLPLILGIGAAVLGATGIGTGVHGGVKLKKAKNTMKAAASRHEANQEDFNLQNKETIEMTDKLGEYELKVLDSFKEFSDVFEKIKNKPDFKEIKANDVVIPVFDHVELKKASVGAGVLLGGLGGAAAGTAGGFAAAGVTTAAVMALGTASTGTAISTLTGVAATNATLAALGGGSLAAGGGGMALGTIVLGASSAGIALLVGGIIFDIAGNSVSKKADKAYDEMLKAEKQINKVCKYLNNLYHVSKNYLDAFRRVNKFYSQKLKAISSIVNVEGRVDYLEYSNEEKKTLENLVLLVSVLYNMCKVKLTDDSSSKELKTINEKDISTMISTADDAILEIVD